MMQNKNVVVKKVCHPRFCRPQDSGISTLFSSSPLEVLSAQCHLFCPPCGESTAKRGKGVVNKYFLFGEGGTQCRVRGKSFFFTTRSVTPTLRAAIYAGYSGHNGFTLGRHAELVSASRCFMKKEEALNKSSFRAPLRSGFTLIELLVVVLIIGILAAVAVPQYQKVVLKSRLTQAQITLKALVEAEHAYWLSHQEYTNNWDVLDLDIPVPENWVMESGAGSDGIHSFSVYSASLVLGGIGFYYLPNTQQYFCAAEPNTDGSSLCQSFSTQKKECQGIAKDDDLECWFF